MPRSQVPPPEASHAEPSRSLSGSSPAPFCRLSSPSARTARCAYSSPLVRRAPPLRAAGGRLQEREQGALHALHRGRPGQAARAVVRLRPALAEGAHRPARDGAGVLRRSRPPPLPVSPPPTPPALRLAVPGPPGHVSRPPSDLNESSTSIEAGRGGGVDGGGGGRGSTADRQHGLVASSTVLVSGPKVVDRVVVVVQGCCDEMVPCPRAVGSPMMVRSALV